jgi:hypothetical protein
MMDPQPTLEVLAQSTPMPINFALEGITSWMPEHTVNELSTTRPNTSHTVRPGGCQLACYRRWAGLTGMWCTCINSLFLKLPCDWDASDFPSWPGLRV